MTIHEMMRKAEEGAARLDGRAFEAVEVGRPKASDLAAADRFVYPTSSLLPPMTL